jgi:hypothetical protein
MLTSWDYDNTAGHFQQFAKGGTQQDTLTNNHRRLHQQNQADI